MIHLKLNNHSFIHFRMTLKNWQKPAVNFIIINNNNNNNKEGYNTASATIKLNYHS